MTKGTYSMGKKSGKRTQVIRCRRCGKKTYHKSHKTCSSCGYGKSKKLRSYAWQNKTGTGNHKKQKTIIRTKKANRRLPRIQH